MVSTTRAFKSSFLLSTVAGDKPEMSMWVARSIWSCWSSLFWIFTMSPQAPPTTVSISLRRVSTCASCWMKVNEKKKKTSFSVWFVHGHKSQMQTSRNKILEREIKNFFFCPRSRFAWMGTTAMGTFSLFFNRLHRFENNCERTFKKCNLQSGEEKGFDVEAEENNKKVVTKTTSKCFRAHTWWRSSVEERRKEAGSWFTGSVVDDACLSSKSRRFEKCHEFAIVRLTTTMWIGGTEQQLRWLRVWWMNWDHTR